nr:hypothetical protein [uncultured Roseovarius sp.]
MPQLLGGFGALGAIMGAVAAIGIPLASAFLGAAKSTDDLEKSMKDLQSATQDAKDELLLLVSGVDNLAQAKAMARINDLLAKRAQLERDLQQFQGARLGPTAQIADGLQRQLDAVNDQIDAEQILVDQYVDATEQLEASRDAARALYDTITSIDLSPIISQADVLVARFTSAASAIGQMMAAAGRAGRRAISETQQIQLQEFELNQRQSGASDASIAGGLAAMRERFRLEGEGIPPALVERLVNEARERGETIAANRDAISDLRNPTTGTSRSTVNQINQTAQAYDRLIASLDPAAQAAQNFARAQDTIAQAQAAGIITAEEAARAYDLARVEYDEMIERAEDATGELGDIARETGDAVNDLLDGILGKGADAADILENLAVQMIKLGLQKQLSTSFPSIFGKDGFMSFDGGGFTGGGSRTGGVDGRGGFPAILHPNETVVDHTKAANSNSGGGGTTVQINNYAGDTETRQRRQSGPNGETIIIDVVNKSAASGRLTGVSGRYGLRDQKVRR